MKKNILHGFLLGLSVMVLSVGSAKADNYTSTAGGGLFNNPGTWGVSLTSEQMLAAIQAGTNTFTVSEGATVIVNDSVNVLDLKVNGILVFGKNEEENKTVIVNGTFTVNGSVDVADVEGTHVLRVKGGFVNNGIIGLRRSSIKVVNVVFDGSQTISGSGSGTFNNIEIASGTVTNSMNLDIDGSFTIDEGATFNAGSSTLLYVAGNFTNKASADNFVRGTSIVELNGKNVQTISGNIRFNELKINGGGFVVVSNTIDVGGNFEITNNSTLNSSAELHFYKGFTVEAGSTYDTNTSYTCFWGGYTGGSRPTTVLDTSQTITINGEALFAGISCHSGSDVGTKTFHGNIYSTAEIRAWSKAKIVDDASSYLHTFSGAIAEGGIELQSPMRIIGGTIRNHNVSPDMSDGVLSSYSLGTGKITIAGTVSVRAGGTLNVKNDVEIESGYILLAGSYELTGSDTTAWYQAMLNGNGNNTLTVKNGTSLYMRGKNNYPTNFNNLIFEETSTAYYDAEFDQIVHEGNYGSLCLRYYNKWFQGNTNIAYHLYVYPGTNGWVNAQMGGHSHTIGYYIYDDPTLNGETNITSTGTVTMKCSGNRAQYILKRGDGTYEFNNLYFESNDPTYAQTKYITGDIKVNGTLSLSNNSTNELLNLSLDIDNHEIVGGTESTFILGNNCRIKTSGASNFFNMTESFNHFNLHNNSVVQFDATDVEQIIPGTTYGNIYLYGNTVKRLDAANPHIVIKGWIDDNGYTPVFTVGNSNAQIEIEGDWLLETAKVNINPNAIVMFNGRFEQEIVQTTLPNVEMVGSLTKTLKSSLTVMGNLVVHPGCEVNADNRTIYLYGNYVNADGSGGTFHQLAGSLYLRGTGNTQTINVSNPNSNQFNNIYIEKNQDDTCRFLTDVKMGGNLMTANKKGHIDIQNHTITIGGDLYMYQTCNLLHDGDKAMLHLSSSTTEQRISNFNPSIIYPTIRFSGSAVKRLLENSIDIDGDVIIDNDAIVTSGKNMYVSGDWKNSGTFNHSAEMWFDGVNQEISGSAFYNVMFSGTGTKTLTGNINVAGWLKIDSLATLDVGPDSYGITVNSYWYNNIWNDKHNKTGTFVPREGTVTFVGNNSWEYTGDSLNANGVGRPGKSFYNVTVSLSDATNYTGLYPIYKTSNKIKSEQNDMYIQNNLTINNGIFYLYWNNLFVGGDLKNLGGTFSMNAHYSQYPKLYLGGTTTHKFDPGKNHTVRQIEVVNGGKYELENDFVLDGSSVDSLLFINNGEFSFNHHSIRMTSSVGNVIIGEHGTMTLDSAAVLAMYSGRHIYNYGHLNLLGDKDSPAKIQPASSGWYYYIVQHSGELAANYYCIEGTRGRGLEIRGGTINNTYHLQNGEFSNSGYSWNSTDTAFYHKKEAENTALLTLNGITLKGGGTLEVSNVTFNSRDGWPKKNVQRTSGSGVIKFTNYGGTMAGPSFELDGGSLIEWETIAGFVWSGEGDDDNWRTKGNWVGGKVPGANDVVFLDHTKVAGSYTVRVDSQAVVNNLTIADNVTLQINGSDEQPKYGLIVNGKLNMLSNSVLSQTAKRDSLVLHGSWTSAGEYTPNGQSVVFAPTTGTHQLTFPAGDTIGAIVMRGPGSLSILGTINVHDSVALNGGTLIGNNATLKLMGDWIPRGGTFDIRESKIYFSGNKDGATQKIYGGRFWGIYFENASQKQFEDNISVYNTFEIEDNSATVRAGVHNIYMTGNKTTNWYNKSANPGVFDQTGSGSVIFNGSTSVIGKAGDAYGPTKFNNVLIQGTGSKYFYDIAYVKGSFEIVAGTNVEIMNGGGIDGEHSGTLQMNGGGYYIFGEDNFAKNMAVYDLSGGTVYYRDSCAQSIFNTTYSGLCIYNYYKTSGDTREPLKTLKDDITVTGTLTINDSLAILNVDNHTITLTGGISMAAKGHQILWGENGTLIHVGGSWDVSSNITDFCNVQKRGTGYLRANNNWNITGDMDFLSETQLYMRGFTIDCKVPGQGKSFSMGASSQLHTEVDASLGVAFPTGFDHYELDETSVTYLEGGTDQRLFAGVDYGRLYLNNTAVRTVELTGETHVRNNLYVNQNDIKLVDNGNDLYLEGASNDLRNYIPTSTLYLDGNQDQQVYAGGSYTNLYINNLKISGSGVKEINETNVYITGDIDVALGSTFSCNDPVMFSGDKITNLGNFNHYGSLFTFTGAKEQTISMDTANQFYGLAVADADTVTIIGNGIKVGNGFFTLGNDSKLDMGAFTHQIAATQIDKVASSIWITENSNFIFNRANTQYLPAMECKDIQFSTSNTKYLRGDLHAQNVTVDAGVGFSVGSNANEAYDVYVSGSWTNNGTFTSQNQTVYFETPVLDNGKTITSNESWFNKVVFNQTENAPSIYKLQDRMLLKDDMIIGANATVHLNGQNLVIGNDDPNATSNPYRPRGEKVNVLPNGHLYVDEGAALLFDHNDDNTQLNVEGKLSLIGSSTANAVVGRYSGSDYIGTEVNIEAGATIAANYYQVQYLAPTGFIIDKEATIDKKDNLSNGIWSNMYTGNKYTSIIDKTTVIDTFVYLTINVDSWSVTDTIKNLSFIHGGTPLVGTHFNLRRDTTKTDTVRLGGNITGNMGYQNYEWLAYYQGKDKVAEPYTHKIKWPEIKQIVWTGAVNSDWFNPNNWLPRKKPTKELSVFIPLTANSPIIYRNGAECKNLTIVNGSLSIEDDVLAPALTVHGSVDVQDGGVLSVEKDEEIVVYGDWSIAAKARFIPQQGIVRFMAEGGSVSITPRKSDFNTIIFDGGATYMLAGSPINIKGNFIVNGGLVWPAATSYVYNIYGNYTIGENGNFYQNVTGFVNFAGETQSITNGKFNRVRFSNSGNKILNGAFSAIYNNSSRTYRTIIVEDAANLVVSSGCALSISGNVLIDTGASFDDGGETHTFTGYYWEGLGGHSGSGKVLFSANTHVQYIYGGKFHNLEMTKSTKYINGDVTLTGDLSIYSCTLDMLINTIKGDNNGTKGTFAMGASSNIYARGDDNYPKFGNYTVTETSKSYYAGPMNQTIRAANYGYLYLNSDTEKSLEGDVNILMDLYFYDNGGTLYANDHNIFLGRNWNNQFSGKFVPGRGGVVFNGSAGTQYAYLGVSVENPFYNVTVQKAVGQTFTPSGTNLEIQNSLMVNSGKMSCPTGYTVFIGGDMQVSSDGLIAQSGCYEFNREYGTSNIQTNGSILNDVVINGGESCVFKLNDNFTAYGNFTVQEGIFNQNGYTATLGNSTDNIIIYGTYKVGASGILRIGDASTLAVKAGGRIEIIGDESHYAQVTNNSGRYYFNVESGATIAAQYYNISYLAKQGLIIFHDAVVDAEDNFSNGIFSNVVSAGVCLDFRSEQEFEGVGTGKRIENISFPNNPGGGAVNIKKTECSKGKIYVYNATGMLAGELYENDPNNCIFWLGDVEYEWTAGANTNDWFDKRNWKATQNGAVIGNEIPTESTNVVIPSPPEKNNKYPIITRDSAMAKKLTIDRGAFLTLNLVMGDVDSLGKALVVLSDMEINGTFEATTAKDTVSVYGNWAVSSYGKVTAGLGAVEICGVGIKTINNYTYNLNDLIINNNGTAQIQRALTVAGNFEIKQGAFDVTTSNYQLTVGGNFINNGNFMAQTGTLSLNGSGSTLKFNPGRSSYNNVIFNGIGTYTLSGNALNINHNLEINKGKLVVGANYINAGDGSGVDYLNIAGILDLQENAKLKMGNNATINVNDGGLISMIGTANNEVVVTTQNNAGTYAFNINNGGTISADHYKIERINADGVHMKKGSHFGTYNLSNGQFVSGTTGGRYLWFENDLDTDDASEKITNVSFNTGAKYNAKRDDATTLGKIDFEDSFGVVASYYFEDDGDEISPTDGAIIWSYTATTLYWVGGNNNGPTNWHNPFNWQNVGGTGEAAPDDGTLVFIPDVSTASNKYPVISESDGEALGITLFAGSSLTVGNGKNLTVKNALSIASGATFTASDGTNPSTISISGQLSNAGNFKHGGKSTVVWTSDNSYDIAMNNCPLYNFTIDNAPESTVTFSMKSGESLTVENNFTINGGTIDCKGGTLVVKGNFHNEGGIFEHGNGTVKLNGTGDQKITSKVGRLDFYNLELIGSGKDTIGVDISIEKAITIGATVSAPTADILCYGDWKMPSGSNYSDNFHGGDGKVSFCGTNRQTIGKQETFTNVEFNNSSAIPAFTTSYGITITDSLILTRGILQSTPQYVRLGANAKLIGGGESAYINGKLVKVGSADFLFPIGGSDRYAPLKISGLTKSGEYSVSYYSVMPSYQDSLPAKVNSISKKEYWELNRISGPMPKVSLYWMDRNYSGLEDLEVASVVLYTENRWQRQIGDAEQYNPLDSVKPLPGYEGHPGDTLKGYVTTPDTIMTSGMLTFGFTYPTVYWLENAVSDDYNVKEGNWQGKHAPDNATNIVVGFASLNHPVVKKASNCYDMNINEGGILEVAAGQTLTVHGNATIASGGTLKLKENSKVIFLRDVNADPSSIIEAESGSEVRISGKTNQLVALKECNNIVFEGGTGPKAKYTKTLNSDIQINGSLNITDHTKLSPGNHTIGLKGDFGITTNGDFDGTSTVLLNGETKQTIDISPNRWLHNLTVDNSCAKSPQVELGSTTKVLNQLTLTKGIIKSTSSHRLVMLRGSNTNGGNENSYVIGPMEKQGPDDFVFPIGADTVLGKIGIWGLGNTDVNIVAEYANARPSRVKPRDESLTNVSTIEYWKLYKTTSGSNNPYLTLYWQDSERSQIGNDVLLRVTVYNDGKWNDYGNDGSNMKDGSGYVKSRNKVNLAVNTSTSSAHKGVARLYAAPKAMGSSNVTMVTFASIDPIINPLPIELFSFDATVTPNNDVRLNWSTASEHNNAYFTIEHTFNGETEMIADVEAQGVAGEGADYSYLHINQPAGTHYYRLHQTDFDGTTTVASDWVAVVVEDAEQPVLQASVAPNPGRCQNIKISVSGISGGKFRYVVADMSGQTVIDRTVGTAGATSYQIDAIDWNLQPSVYLLKVFTDNGQTVSKFVVE
ncbi:MAG: T9SS type A sorting domain-containing protein [Salinivirgaceae bacterium]|nr:T9SS type A sorting domain-containing protein [Salinivirgaceae bacterium]